MHAMAIADQRWVAAATVACGLVTACGNDRAATAPAAPDLVCDEVDTVSEPGAEPHTQYRRYAWFADRRVRALERRPDGAFTGSFSEASRYDEAGKRITHVTWADAEPGHIDAQNDFYYDAHDNLADVHISFPDPPDVDTTSSAALSVGFRYDNRYDAAGRLVSSTRMPYGPDLQPEGYSLTSYEEDEQGRCARSVNRPTGSTSIFPNTPSVVTWAYDMEDRVIEQQRSMGDCTSTERTSYGPEGRPLEQRTWECRPVDEEPSSRRIYAYAADGSSTQTVFLSDPNTAASRLTRSAGCAEISAAIGVRHDARCRVDAD